ncbi:hypothetical protein K438DRAFT_1836391 [Mycena galopus ATCC 62051]|nr:hypothetical protein K438DRAFT_1836391 [Mycena galopus ATCC 62051]
MSEPIPRLPAELEYHIFEISAHLHPKSIPILLLVARRVKIWLEPVLYNVIVFDAEWTGDYPSPWPRFDPARFSPALHSRAFSQHVKNLLCIHVRVPLKTIFANCSAVHNLVLVVHGSTPTFPSAMPLRRLCTQLKRLFSSTGVDFTHSLFSHITHLELIDRFIERGEHWRGLALIPSLTHLAFWQMQQQSIPVLRATLTACPTLRVLVCLHYDPMDPGEYSEKDPWKGFEVLGQNTRFVCMITSHFAQDWHIGARGGEDFWIRAERLIAQRNSSEMDRETFILLER